MAKQHDRPGRTGGGRHDPVDVNQKVQRALVPLEVLGRNREPVLRVHIGPEALPRKGPRQNKHHVVPKRFTHLRNVKGCLGPARRRAEPVDDVADADAHLIV